MTYQSTARKSSSKQAAQARRLLANVSVAPHVLAGTVTDENFPAEQSVSYRIASEDFVAGALHIARRQGYYLVECCVAPGRYYVVVRTGNDYQCSIAKDERLLAKLTVKVIEYRTAPVLTEETYLDRMAAKYAEHNRRAAPQEYRIREREEFGDFLPEYRCLATGWETFLDTRPGLHKLALSVRCETREEAEAFLAKQPALKEVA